MSKKFTKTVLSTALAGVLFGISFGGIAANKKTVTVGDYTITFLDNKAAIKAAIITKKDKNTLNPIGIVNTETGSIMSYNNTEMENAYAALKKKFNGNDTSPGFKEELQDIANKISFPVYSDAFKLKNLENISLADLNKAVTLKENVSSRITSETAQNYINIVKNSGGDTGYLSAIVGDVDSKTINNIKDIKDIKDNINKLSNAVDFYLDETGNITLEDKGDYGTISVKETVAGLVDDTTVRVNDDGSLTMDRGAQQTKRVNEALVDLDKSIKDRTTVGVSSDGTLTRAEGAKNTISVNDGLVALSGRTDRIDAAVGAIDGRVTRNTQSIEKNSKAIAANTRTLQQHSARLDSQQRQINENHKEMKRAAAQSAALTGLFQPYSVGKFNATAAVGGYSDQQALAVGVGYRFNEQTAAKAGVAFSDGDASW
ncbi:TPA: YadA-like family protein, partial [Escherichia coli]|nr:hypothetical protein [Escherichia coli]HCY2364278.1 YadA-like family protein [Escherichia coli]HCY2427092.1 YadA-like family protein [Escherichia coli]